MKKEPTLALPKKLRSKLQQPLGQLFLDIPTLVKRLREIHPPRVITVGDSVTAGLLVAGIAPDIAVVDLIEMRELITEKKKELIDSFKGKVIRVKNPPATLTPELRAAFKQAEPPLKIIVDGEEDLAVLPAALSAPEGSVVIYGQPKKGVVMVEVTEEKCSEFKKLLAQFERKGV